MIRRVSVVSALTMTLLLAGVSVRAQDLEFFPVDELREGMTGVGKTVFHGTAIEEFEVEILGVLKNSGPRQDMVLARLSGGPLDDTGVLQGMSGSPVYIDGRLLGAVAFAFTSSMEPIAGIQPISQMVNVLDEPMPAAVASSGSLPSEGVRSYMNGVMTGLRVGDPFERYLVPSVWSRFNPAAAAIESAGLAPIRTPLFVGGVSPLAMREFEEALEAFGFTSVQGGVTGSVGQLTGAQDAEVLPGASINAELVRGDISVSANGTVTHVDGDRVYAFGHPFQSTGPTDLPMSLGYVLSLVPTRSTSFKIAVPMDVVGNFQQDRSTGISGELGGQASMIPVRVDLQTSRNGIETYEYEVVNDRFMTPLMMNLTLFELILATERSLGASTLEIEGNLRLGSGESVEISNAFAGDLNAPAQATIATVAPITYLLSSGFEALSIESIELTVRSTDTRRMARLDTLRVDRTEVRAGETITLEATLRTPDGNEFVEDYTVAIPDGLAPGRVELLVGDGVAVTDLDLRRAPAAPPRDTEQIVRELNRLRRMDRLYVKVLSSNQGAVVSGQELPSLPPSMIAMIDTDRSADSHTSGTRNSPVTEFELGNSNYVIEGRQSLDLTVVP